MEYVGVVGAFSFIVGGIVIGLPFIAFGQLLLIFREIAFNTRKEGENKKSNYGAVQTISGLISALGWIILIGGLILGIAAAFIHP